MPKGLTNTFVNSFLFFSLFYYQNEEKHLQALHNKMIKTTKIKNKFVYNGMFHNFVF